MMDKAYRDELEATLARASELEREIEELRRHNVELEAVEARQNSRRLVAAIDRERDEQQRRNDQYRDEATMRRAAKEAARARADAQTLGHWRNGLMILVAGVISALVAGMTNNPGIGVGSAALFVIGLIYLYAAESVARKRRQKADDQ